MAPRPLGPNLHGYWYACSPRPLMIHTHLLEPKTSSRMNCSQARLTRKGSWHLFAARAYRHERLCPSWSLPNETTDRATCSCSVSLKRRQCSSHTCSKLPLFVREVNRYLWARRKFWRDQTVLKDGRLERIFHFRSPAWLETTTKLNRTLWK